MLFFRLASRLDLRINPERQVHGSIKCLQKNKVIMMKSNNNNGPTSQLADLKRWERKTNPGILRMVQ